MSNDMNLGSPVKGPSFEEEERAMQGGKGKMLGFLAVLAILVVGGLVALLSMGNDTETYREFGREVNGMHRDHFEQFWRCAMQGPAMENVRNNRDLDSLLIQRATNGRNRYGTMMKDTCLPKLKAMRPKLDAMLPPEEIQTDVVNLSQKIATLATAWEEFIVVLDGSREGFDADASQSKRDEIARAWFEYKRAFGAIQDKIRAKIGG